MDENYDAHQNDDGSFSAPASSSVSLHAARFGKTEAVLPITPRPVSNTDSVNQSLTGSDSDLTAPKIEPKWLTILKAAGVFVVSFAIFFVLLQAPAFYQRAAYWLTHLGKSAEPVVFAQLPILKDRAVTLTDIKADPATYGGGTLGGYSLADLGDDQLLIPRIEVKAPIVWGSASDEGSMLSSLQRGVAHYGFTALPSDGQGKVFLTGHSSFALWDKGEYKTVFANLDKLETGDQLATTYRGLVYVYEVTEKKVVPPSDVSVLEQTTDPTLALMTCVPVGTSKDRLVVFTKLISASPSKPVPLPPPSNIDPASIFHYLSI